MTISVIRWVFLIVFLSGFAYLQAQSDSLVTKNGLSTHFVKYNSTHKVGTGFFFNSIKITNTSPESVTLKPKITTPEGWVIPKFILVPKSIEIAPGKSSFIPFKVLIPSTAEGNTSYPFVAQFYNNEDKEVISVSSTVFIPERRDWSMEVLDKEVILLPTDSTKVRFETKFQNLGNTREIIMLQIQMDDKVENTTFVLPAGSDTVFTIEKEYKETQILEGAQKEYVELFAQSSTDEEYAGVSFMKFKNKFNGANARIRQNYLELSYNNFFSTLGVTSLNLTTGGILPLWNGNDFAYAIDFADLRRIRELINFPILSFYYQGDHFDYQMGNILTLGEALHDIPTMEGRTPENNGFNSLGLTYKYQYDLYNKTEVSVARNIRNPITNVAAGHTYRRGDLIFQGFGSYTLDFFGRKSTKIGTINVEVPFLANHFFNFTANLANETHHLESIGGEDISHLGTETFSQNSNNYRIFYNGTFFNNLHINLFHRFTSAAYPNRSRGTVNTLVGMRYVFPNNKHEFRANYRNFSQPDLIFDNGVAFPQTANGRKEYFVEYFLPVNHMISISGGGFLQDFYSHNRSLLSGELFPYQANTWNAFFSASASIHNSFLTLRGVYGVNTIEDFVDANDGTVYSDIRGITSTNITLNLYSRGFNLGAQYLSGINSLLTFYRPDINDLNGEGFTTFFGWSRFMMKRRLWLTASGNYRQDFANKRSFFSFVPRAQVNLKFGWSAFVSGNFNYIVQTSNGAGARMTFIPQLNTGVRKDFDLIFKNKSYDLKVLCYLDENSNGQYDEGEKTVQDIQIEVAPQAIGKKRNTDFDDTRFPPVTLFSDKTGTMHFKKLPQGSHLLDIRKVAAASRQYILKSNNSMQLELDNDQVLHIPFAEARIIEGKMNFELDKFSRKSYSKSGVRVTATNEKGENFYALTGRDGSYKLALPEGSYIVKINNPFGKDMSISKNNHQVDLVENTNVTIDFDFRQKSKKINFN